ncbi:MAG: Bax inhibitor-1 family protein [Oligoflexus sp.]
MQSERSIPVIGASASSRQEFIRKTYLHLLAAILVFTGLEFFFFSTGIAQSIMEVVAQMNWLIILGGFMIASWIASRFAQASRSKGVQYFGLGLYVLAQAVIFVPLLYIAQMKAGGGVIETAAYATILGFGGLTTIAFGTKADFSWMGKILIWAFVGAIILVVMGTLFGFELGTFFSVAMIVLAGAAILYDTSNIIHHYSEDDYVAASLQLFASVALMFWYVLRLLSSRD